MLLILALACASQTSPPTPAGTAAPTSTEPSAPAPAPAPEAGRPAPPQLPVALYAAHGDRAVPLGAVPAVAPGDAPSAVDSSGLSRWPAEGVLLSTPAGQQRQATGTGPTTCQPSGRTTGAVILNQAVPHGELLVAPAAWADALVTWPSRDADPALLAQLAARGSPTDRVQVADAGDLDGDGQPDRLVFAHGPSVDPEKPAPSTVLWWGAELSPLEGFEFNGGVEPLVQLATPAGPLVVLRSQWMGGVGLHAFVIEASQPRVLGEWVCGT